MMLNSRRRLPLVIEDSEESDIPEIQKIFAYSVLHEVGSLREEPLSEELVAEKRQEVRALGLPHLVARLVPAAIGGLANEENGTQVVGFAYAAPFRPFGAYRFTVEDSIYVASGHRGTGVGRALLSELLVRLERVQVAASPSASASASASTSASSGGGSEIGGGHGAPEHSAQQPPNDHSLKPEPHTLHNVIALIGGGDENRGSVGLHTALGYEHVGTFHKVGYKRGRWLDVALMQRALTSSSK